MGVRVEVAIGSLPGRPYRSPVAVGDHPHPLGRPYRSPVAVGEETIFVCLGVLVAGCRLGVF